MLPVKMPQLYDTSLSFPNFQIRVECLCTLYRSADFFTLKIVLSDKLEYYWILALFGRVFWPVCEKQWRIMKQHLWT